MQQQQSISQLDCDVQLMTETIGVSIGKWMACILHSVSLAGEVTNMEVAEKHIVKLRIQDEAY